MQLDRTGAAIYFGRPAGYFPASSRRFPIEWIYVVAALAILAALGGFASWAHGADVPGQSYVAPGQSIATAIASGNKVIRLQRGGVYGGPVKLKPGVTLTTYGDNAKPAPRVVVSDPAANGVEAIFAAGATVDGIDVSYIGKPGTSKGVGVRFLNSSGGAVLNCRAAGFRMGSTCEAYNPAGGEPTAAQRIKGFRLAGNVVENNVQGPDGSGHSSGFFVSYTDGLDVRGNTFDGNGTTADPDKANYNQTVYIHATCGPAEVHGNVFANGASFGCQARSGGSVTGNLFIDNPIAASYGLVNGAPCFPGGVSGEFAWNVVIGSAKQAGQQRGSALYLGNAKAVSVHDCLFQGDGDSYQRAIVAQAGQGVTNPSQELKPSAWNLAGSRLYVLSWPGGLISDSRAPSSAADEFFKAFTAPAYKPDLRAVLGADFVARSKRSPLSVNPAAIDACFAAVYNGKGTGEPAPPPATQPATQPTTQPAPPPVVRSPITLEDLIRLRPVDMRVSVVNGAATISGASTDPVWTVQGDTVTKR